MIPFLAYDFNYVTLVFCIKNFFLILYFLVKVRGLKRLKANKNINWVDDKTEISVDEMNGGIHVAEKADTIYAW